MFNKNQIAILRNSLYSILVMVVLIAILGFSHLPVVRAQGALSTPTVVNRETPTPTNTDINGPNMTPNIIGGEPAEPGEWPWQVAIIIKEVSNIYDGHICGGTLITSEWVLTAAHCFYRWSNEDEAKNAIDVVAGIYNLKSPVDGYQRRGVSQLIIHPGYVSDTKNNDIALLHLDSPIVIGGSGATKTELITLVPSTIGNLVGENGWATGWGNNPTSRSDILFEVQVPVIANSICNDSIHYNGRITDNMFCAGDDMGLHDTCQGDSGGPYVINANGKWYQAGITSWGEGCWNLFREGVYTRLSNYVEWIYAPICKTLTINTQGGGYVSTFPSNSPGCPYRSFFNGTTVSLMVFPDSGWYFSHWIGTTGDAIADYTITDSATITAVFSEGSNDDEIPATGTWSTPNNGQTINSNTVTLAVNASDNPGGSGVREVRWSAKWNDKWYGIGTDYDSPYSLSWNWCASSVPNGDVELGFEVWDNANNKWVYSANGNVNIHINKNFDCSNSGGSINWSMNFYNGATHFWDINNTDSKMCSDSYSGPNLDRYYGDYVSPCPGGNHDNWVGDYKGTVYFAPGTYLFQVEHDDGLKIFIDGAEYYNVPGTNNEAICHNTKYMSGGNHQIWAILREDGGQARVKINWGTSMDPCGPETFSKSYPSSGLSDMPLDVTLSWAAANRAVSYEYCLDTTNNNSCDSIWLNVGTNTSASVTGLAANTTYYWQARAKSSNGKITDANSNTWWSFNTQVDAPVSFEKNSPANGAISQATSLTLAWAPSAGASWYQYCIDTTNNNICDNDLWYSPQGNTSTELSGLAERTTYYWQVRAINSHGIEYGSNDVWWSFTTLPTFSDVPSSYWAWQFIERLYKAGVTGGCSTTPLMYCPSTNVTRDQMAVFILRAKYGATYTPSAATGMVFSDVPLGHWAGAWIEALAAEGITGGCGDGKYCPNLPVTRDQMAVFLLRGEHGSSYTPPAMSGTLFGDVPPGHWAGAWIEQLANEGITGGCGNGNYCPATVVARDQMAVFLVRAFSLP